MSHPVRVRGLKLTVSDFIKTIKKSHPVRVRGLKQYLCEIIGVELCRTPCGCVD